MRQEFASADWAPGNSASGLLMSQHSLDAAIVCNMHLALDAHLPVRPMLALVAELLQAQRSISICTLIWIGAPIGRILIIWTIDPIVPRIFNARRACRRALDLCWCERQRRCMRVSGRRGSRRNDETQGCDQTPLAPARALHLECWRRI